ncbi:MAG: adenylate/guanylate cyclase domain-containing protein [Pseudomonadota bacterium]
MHPQGRPVRGVMAWLRRGRAAGLVVIALLVTLRILDPTVVSSLRFSAFDLFQQMSPREYAPAPVAIIDIDDPSIEELGQWPWPRTLVAEMVTRAAEAGAVAIGFDVIFAEPDRLSPDLLAADNAAIPDDIRSVLSALPSNDTTLAAAMARTRVVVGQTSVRSARTGIARLRPPAPVPHAIIGEDPTPFLMSFPDLLENLDELEAAALGRGVFTTRPDPDGTYRRVPLVMSVDGAIRLGLAPELLRVATGQDAFAIRTNEAGIDAVIVAGQAIETGPDGTVWPHFTPHVPARYISAADLIKGRMDAGRLQGQIAFVGTSAIGLEDFRPIPLGFSLAGVEIHAQVLEGILLDAMLNRPNYAIAIELVVLACLGVLVVTLVPILAGRWVIIGGLLVLSAYGAFTWWLFEARATLLDPTWPILCTLAMLMLMSTANYLREEQERARIRSAFGQYVSPDLVAQLQDEPEMLTLGGERRELTILFSDVRGFTTLAESFKDDPAGLTQLINRFLSVLSDAILDEGGTIDKFMGDAVMAFWNAPLDHEGHARAACHAALRMQADIATLNKIRAEEGGGDIEPIDVGIGLNTGECTVGNMGSDTRFDYTALGDAVNLASRLEGQSKAFGFPIIVGPSTAEAVQDAFALLRIDRIRVKGKLEPVEVSALIGGEDMRMSPEFEALRQANDALRSAYLTRDWSAARDALQHLEVAAASAGVDATAYVALYRGRVESFMAHPPGVDWDGVTVAETK